MSDKVDMKEKLPITFELYELEGANGVDCHTLIDTITEMVTREDIIALAHEGPFTEFTVGRTEYKFMGVDVKSDDSDTVDLDDTRSFVVMLLKEEHGRTHKFYIDNKTYEGETGFKEKNEWLKKLS